MTVKIEIVSTSWVSKITLACWCVQLLLIFSFLCFIFFTLINVLPILFYCFVLNLFLLLAKFFLSILIYEFSPFSYTLVCYKNVETLFTDRVRNIVITKSPDRDTIVADHMNQVNLSCDAEGNPSVSFIWYKEPDMNTQLSTENLLMIKDLSANKSGTYACRAYNIINGQMYNITETTNVTIGEYIPWLKLSTLQLVGIYHNWNCQDYNR